MEVATYFGSFVLKIEHIYWARCMLKSNNPLGKRIGVARLCHVEGVRCLLDSDQR